MKFLGQLFALGQKRECAMAQPGNTNTDKSYGNLKGGTISERDWNIFIVFFFLFSDRWKKCREGKMEEEP